ncbi:MAG: septum formation initiator family protein [Candidatus Roizmanbacteria bacterium]|nr:MAG: septum formation initiator family protein [Candidatus Roizmanbacteria bacterium]
MKLFKQILVFLLFLFLLTSLIKNFFEYKKNYSFYEDYKNDYEKALKQNTSLKTQILKSNDPNQIEKIIRNKLNLLKSNEVAIVLPNPTPTPVMITPTPIPVYAQWWNTFFKIDL